MAVVGSGPAGFYTSYKVMSSIQNAKVDMYEHLPVPFGLVRFGVAPDHPEVKNCQDKFTEVASSSNFNFVGNVNIGRDIGLQTLREHYDAILFAYGASQDRKLAIEGEGLKGVYSARDFVGWYNGLPEHADLAPDLSTGDLAVVIGQGNVALDVARTLLTDIDVLRKTDIAEHALATLAQSKVRHVSIVGRRGPMQAAFTIKELRELMNLPNATFDHFDKRLLPPFDTKLARTPKRMVSLLRQGSSAECCNADKTWALKFLLSPHRFVGDGRAALNVIEFHANRFVNQDEQFQPGAKVEVAPTGEIAAIGSNLAFRSIGYKSIPIDGIQDLGIHFDERNGIIPNDAYGRITSSSSSTVVGGEDTLPGLYCAGWVKRGPAGVIANTMEDAFATAEAIASDWEKSRPFLLGGEGWDALSNDVAIQRARSVSWNDWLKIDEAEKSRGKLRGKPREKFPRVEEMLSVLD